MPDYVSQTILAAATNIIRFLAASSIVLYLAVSIVLNLIRAVFRFPLLKQLDWLAGGAFGFARVRPLLCAVCGVLLALTMVPFDQVSEMIDQSHLAAFFNNGNLICPL